MKYLTGIGIKFAMMLGIIWIVLGGFFGAELSNVLAISLVLAAISFLGDVFILPGIKDVTAAIADFFINWVGVWLLAAWFIEQPMALGFASFFTAIVLTVGEIFYHMYMRRQFFNQASSDEENQSTSSSPEEEQQRERSTRDLQTEYGEDMYAKLSAKDPKSKKQQ